MKKEEPQRVHFGNNNSRDRRYIHFPEAPGTVVLVTNSSASIGCRLDKLWCLYLHIFLGYFCGVTLDMVPDSVASHPGFQAFLELMLDTQYSFKNSVV